MKNRIALVIRIVLGCVFLYASVHKILDPAGFAAAIYNYRILPDELINIAALVLPWVELILGICLIGGWWLPGAVALTNLLFITFTAALLFNVVRGLDINCGCFSTAPASSEASSALWYVLRDLLFLLFSGYLFLYVLRRGKKADNETP